MMLVLFITLILRHIYIYGLIKRKNFKLKRRYEYKKRQIIKNDMPMILYIADVFSFLFYKFLL